MKSPFALATLTSCVTASCFITAAQAASPIQVPEKLQACSKLQDAGERVRCYDTQIAAMNAAAAANETSKAGSTPGPTTTTATIPPPITSPATTSSNTTSPSTTSPAASAPGSAAARATFPRRPDAKFGEEFLPATERAASPQQESVLHSSITAMSQLGPKIFAISLANGQVWRQEEASHIALFFRVGDDVRIEKGTLGSYHMSTAATGSKNWVRVTRVQ